MPRPDDVTDLERWLNNPLVGLGGLELHPEPGLAVVPDQQAYGHQTPPGSVGIVA